MTVRVTGIELREIRLPLREPFRISSGAVTDRRILLVRVTDADGVVAWSECVAGEQPNYSSETIDTAWFAIREWFAPRLLAARPAGGGSAAPAAHSGSAPGASATRAPPASGAAIAFAVDALLAKGVRGHRMARAPLEMAVWAIEAERRGVPLARLIGGIRTHVETGISLGIQDTPTALVDRARDAVNAGYRKVKLKIAPGADIQYVAAVREALGDAAPLMVDANNAYTIADIETLRRLDQFGLIMIEQPLDHEDIVRHAELQRALRTPICLDESITSLDRAQDMITLGSGRIVNIKPGRVGGFTQSIAIHDLCARHGVPVWCGGMLESGIGRAYNVALASLPDFTIPGDISPSARYWTRDVVTPEWTMTDGRLTVPDRPGIGVSVDVDSIDDLTVRTESLNGR